jgi:uncharacterized protein (DUF488 family)
MPVTIYTVGYGNRSLDDLLALLDARAIDFLLDVRSRPFSRFRPEFSKEPLEQGIREAGLNYAWLGAQLGGIPDAPDVQREDGTIDGRRWIESAPFQLGIARLLRAQTAQYRVALMCAELRPEDCHRSRLIGAELLRHGIDVIHIDEEGRDLPQTAMIERQIRGQHDLFDAAPGEPSRRGAGEEGDGAGPAFDRPHSPTSDPASEVEDDCDPGSSHD